MVEHRFYTASVGGSIPSSRTIYALVAELVDALVLGTSGQPWEFESLQAHQFIMARESGWLRRCPVTAEIMGSNPIRVAIATLDNTLSSPLNLRIEDLLRACSSGGERLLCKQNVGGSIPSRSTKGSLDHCFQIMSGGLVATDLNQVMPLGLIRDCLRFAGERALLRSSRQGR